jgi:ATP-dependent DNA helicase RecQ
MLKRWSKMPNSLLQRYFGYSEFRQGQLELIEQLLGGGDCLGVMPTGAGKSMCYQLPALALDGLMLVISPLISLMHDQVGALVDAGIKAAYLNSSLTPTQRVEVLAQAKAGEYQLLYIAPERLEAADFLNFAKEAQIALIAVDEAHCISQWGQDFRPSYLKIPEFIESLAPRPPVGAFTATATKGVKTDIAELLRLRDPLALTTGFDRPNLHFAVSKPSDKTAHLLQFLRTGSFSSGIVYCATRNGVEEVCQELADAGFAATRYHAGLTERERKANQDDFLYDRKTIMVATNAFGMGIDKSNVNFVVHYNMPKNLESYYQEAGRAGRDGTPATCLLLYAPKDVQTNIFLITHNEDSSNLDEQSREELQQKDLELLKQMTFYATTNECLRAFILDYFGEQTSSYCANCSNCLTAFEDFDATTHAQKIISCVYRLKQRGRSFGKSMVVNILRGSKNKRIMQMGLNSLSTYGIMADTSPQRIFNIIDSLVMAQYLQIGGGEYATLQLSESYKQLLAPDAQYLIKLPKELEREKRDKALANRAATKRETSGVSALSDPADIDLFEALRTLRFEIATAADKPAYIVFSDATLRAMAQQRPSTPETFLQVPGVGAKKLETYGQAFMDCIANFKQHP